MKSKDGKDISRKQPATGGEALMHTLADHGVEYIFGYTGGAALPLFDAIQTAGTDIKLIAARHEQGAMHIADGYARASGKVGVAIVTSGPGATNTITGLMTAQMDSSPIAVFSGQVPTTAPADAFQSADIVGMAGYVTKHAIKAQNAHELPLLTHEALQKTTSNRPGAVLVDIPKDVGGGRFAGNLERPDKPTISAEVDRSTVRAVAKEWRSAERPLILAGQGVIIAGASPELRALAVNEATPVTTTLLGKGAFPESHDLSVGMLGMHGTAYANKAIMECDFLLNLGSRFDDRIVGKASKFCEGAFIVHCDMDPREIGKIITPGIGIVADAKQFLTALSEELQQTAREADRDEWLTQIAKYRSEYPLEYQVGDSLTMQQVIAEAHRQTRGNAIVTTDVGQHQMWAAQFWKTDDPRTWISSGGAGTMGFGLPAAIGAQFARPTETVIAFVGDGGFQMTSYELATAVKHKLPIKIFILDNGCLGMVRQWQEKFYGNRESAIDLSDNPDFVKLAEAYGAAGVYIDSEDGVQAGLAEAFAISDGPVIIHARVRREDSVYPFIPAGEEYDQMQTGPSDVVLAQPSGST